MDAQARFRAALIDSQIDTLEILYVGGTLTLEHVEQRAAELAVEPLSEQQKARLDTLTQNVKDRAGFSVN